MVNEFGLNDDQALRMELVQRFTYINRSICDVLMDADEAYKYIKEGVEECPSE